MEKKMRHTLIYVVVCASVGALLATPGCNTCSETAGAKVESQSHEYFASTEGADCGAVSGYETAVKVQHPTYVSGARVWTSKETVFVGRLGLGQLSLKWTDDHHLSITCDCSKENVIFSTDHWRAVRIDYSFLQ